MKTTFITLALFGACAGNTFAQDGGDLDNREKFKIGGKVGVNYSNVYDEQGDEFKAESKFGGAAGAFMEIPIGKYLGIKPEGVISQKGFKATGMILDGRYSFTRTTTYIDIPLQIQLKPSEFISLVAGPQFSYLLNQRDVFENALTTIEQEREFENDNIRKNIFGVVAGLDINLKHITLGARVNWDVQNNNGDGTSNTPRYKNAWVQGTIGYAFFSN